MMDYRSQVNSNAKCPRVLLVGDSGVGKTTFINSLNQQLRRGAAMAGAGGGGVASPGTNGRGGGYASPSPSAGNNSPDDRGGAAGGSGRSSQQPPPSTLGISCDAVCIRYGGAIKAVEVVEIGGNRTFAPTARQTVFRGGSVSCVFLFYRPDSPESIVALSYWYEEVKKEVIERLQQQQQQQQNNNPNPYNASYPSSNNLFSSSSPVPTKVNSFNSSTIMGFYGGGGNATHGGGGTSTPPRQHSNAQSPNHFGANADYGHAMRGGGSGYQQPLNNNGNPNPVKIVLVSVIDPKSNSLRRSAASGGNNSNNYAYAYAEGGGGGASNSYDSYYQSSSSSSSGGGGGYYYSEPVVLFRNTGVEPFGRFIGKVAKILWHITMLFLSILLLGPGQKVVPFKPPNLQEIIRTIENDPYFTQNITLEFAPNSKNKIDFGESLDDIVQLLVTLTAD